MILLLRDDLSKNLSKREFTHRIGLANPLPIVLDGLLFVFQVEPKHLFGLVGNFDFFWDAGGPPAKIIDLSSKEDCVIEFFRSMAFEFGGDIIKSGAFDCLTIDRVGDNGLILAR